MQVVGSHGESIVLRMLQYTPVDAGGIGVGDSPVRFVNVYDTTQDHVPMPLEYALASKIAPVHGMLGPSNGFCFGSWKTLRQGS